MTSTKSEFVLTGRLDAFEWKVPVTATAPLLFDPLDAPAAPSMIEGSPSGNALEDRQPAN
jgi:uncharacterized membrane-anchored protein